MSSIEYSLKTLSSPNSSEILQAQNSLTFKLLKTVADFSQALSTLHDKFGHDLQLLVENFRKRNGELRKERLPCPSSLFQVWELFLQQVEVNSQQHGDISRNFCQTIGNGLVERIFYRKIQSKKIFAHRDRIETIILKSNELLLKCYADYCQAYALALTNPAQYMSEYIASHNVYVHQLQATNGMIHAYQTKTLPKLLEELEDCQVETGAGIASSLNESSEFVYQKASGYQLIGGACKQADPRHDLALFVKAAQQQQPSQAADHLQQQQQQQRSDESAGGDAADHQHPSGANPSGSQLRYHQFQQPNLQRAGLAQPLAEPKNMQIVPTFKNEIAPDLSQPPSQQQPQLEQDRASLEEKIEKLEERIEALGRQIGRQMETRNYNKVNELQEDLSQRRFELQVAQIHLSAVRSQLQLFEYNYRPGHALALLAGAAAAASGNQSQGATLAGCHQADAAESGCESGGGVAAGAAGSLTLLAAGHQMGGSNYQLSSMGMQSGASQAAAGAAGLAATRKGGASNLHHNQTAGYRNKWIKAFKSLKEPAAASSQEHQKFVGPDSGEQNKQDSLQMQQQQQQLQSQTQTQSQQTGANQLDNQHFFQEYTFKKIASCDVCKDFLRGHMRQGVKCKLCKISCHNDCQSKAHASIKCQQPKIKLLRRQKSAGELEVNNSDLEGSEPTTERSSKPDSIYSLIRQVLDAKKRGHHHQQQQQQQQQPAVHPSLLLQTNDLRGQLGNSAFMLSSGNLSLANQNGGKSVSTSALQGGPTASNASVDRWAVVMELLAQSRKKDKENQPEAGELAVGGGGGGKRHSKQLDKFKSAAKSAAAASRHQYIQQQQQQQQQHYGSSMQQQQQLGASSSSPLSHQYANDHSMLGADGGYLNQQPQPMHLLAAAQQPPSLSNESGGLQQQQQQASQLHLHHTKSLPIGNKQQQQQIVGAPLQPSTMLQQQPQPLMMSVPMAAAAPSPAPGSSFGPPPQQQQAYHLNIGSQQQLQSTSAPHSPQRKRFNLRMKSFSLDSPETPAAVQQLNVAMPAGSSSSMLGSSASTVAAPAGAGYAPQAAFEQQQLFAHQHQQLYQQQQQQQHLYANQSAAYQPSPAGSYHLAGAAGYQQQPSGQFEGCELGASAYWRQARQQYNHRHSYHNPPFHYQHHDNSNPKQQAAGSGNKGGGGSSSNLSEPVAGGQHAPASSSASAAAATRRRGSSLGLELASASSSKQQRPGGGLGAPLANSSNQLKPRAGSGELLARANSPSDYYDLTLDVSLRSQADAAAAGQQQSSKSQQQQQQPQKPPPGGTYVALYDYNAQRADEIQLSAGQLVALVDSDERDWWKIRPLDGSNRVGYFPASYLAELYHNERPLQVVQTIQVSDGEICDKLLRGQIVMHTGKQMDSFVTIRLVANDSSNHYIQCPEKYLMEVVEPG